ncbi:hypothetical protein [Paraburkholderia kirstenboschensis]|uniref:Uncharacterized protein n=1 Tax=Paraburkholderia kirstenboschensis TaxID=1245436 RepID=A0ABZ0ESQ4_9BURK|nr:hypothetical protein [Paraburkholderia kirstenboschensis]WOD19103.1 hypothetical protein RW095_22840 [Paraburkholderia kirstenboschensis]
MRQFHSDWVVTHAQSSNQNVGKQHVQSYSPRQIQSKDYAALNANANIKLNLNTEQNMQKVRKQKTPLLKALIPAIAVSAAA